MAEILTLVIRNERRRFAGQQAVFVDQMLNVLYALLALAVIVAVLGIVNTLALNVIERRQEIGMLRAVGTSRRQVRRMITLEAVQISIYGAVTGVIVGLASAGPSSRCSPTRGWTRSTCRGARSSACFSRPV